jgi:hypothetical protein
MRQHGISSHGKHRNPGQHKILAKIHCRLMERNPFLSTSERSSSRSIAKT